MLNFHQHFRRQVTVLQQSLDSLSEPGISSVDQKIGTDQLVADLAKLSAELADAAGDLPSYDQRSYTQAIRELQDKLTVTRASLAPKPKFSFKNKRLLSPSPAPDSASTSRSVTPSHLQEPKPVKDGPVPALASPPTHLELSRDSSVTPSDRNDDVPTSDTSEVNQIILKDRSREYITLPRDISLSTQTSSGQGCVVSNIRSSVVDLVQPDDSLGSPQTESPTTLPFLTLNDITSSVIIASNVSGPIHMTNVQDCTLILECQQFRMHKSSNVDVYLFCPSRPIIEDCSNIRFTHSYVQGETGRKNMYDQVDDFKWLRAEPSPNWGLMKDEERISEDRWTDIVEELRRLSADKDDADESGSKELVDKVLRVFRIEAAT